MYICKVCGEEFENRFKLGGHVLHSHKKENEGSKKVLRRNKEEYEKNPRYCLECGKIFSYDKIRSHKLAKFCSQKCNGLYNGKSSQGTIKIERTLCLNCGEVVKGTKNKFCCQECSTEYRKKEYLKKWLETKELPIASGGKIATIVRDFLLEEQHGKCSICGIENVWCGKPLTFIVDHIDGNSSDCSRENLRLICSNCDSQTDTYKGKNKGNGRFFRKERYQANKSF